MLTRREFCASAMAGMSLTTPAFAHHTNKSKGPSWQVPPEKQPRIVELDEYIPAGEIHVDPNFFALYLALPDYKALRYTVAVAAAPLWEPGEYYVKWKAQWPRWRPTNAMIKRDPDKYKKYANGMEGGPRNPLGARALYLYQGNRDTYLRIHGTTQPWTIGTAVSNGCARMVNEHVIDLYDRTEKNAKVVLHPRWIDTAKET